MLIMKTINIFKYMGAIYDFMIFVSGLTRQTESILIFLLSNAATLTASRPNMSTSVLHVDMSKCRLE